MQRKTSQFGQVLMEGEIYLDNINVEWSVPFKWNQTFSVVVCPNNAILYQGNHVDSTFEGSLEMSF